MSASFSEWMSSSEQIDAIWKWQAGERSDSGIVEADACADVICYFERNKLNDFVISATTLNAFKAQIGPRNVILGVRMSLAWGGQLISHKNQIHSEFFKHLSATTPESISCLIETILGNFLGGLVPPNVVSDFLCESWSMVELSHFLRTSAAERQLQRECRKWVGVAPIALLNLRRIQRAKSLLKKNWPIVDVVGELSFSDKSHLTRECQRSLGSTPRTIQNVGNLQDSKPIAL